MNKYDAWKSLELTEVKNYSQNDFKFIVHAINTPGDQMSNFLFFEKLMSNGEEDKSQNIDLINQAKRISERKLISCSLISNTKLGMLKSVGLILKMPVENILFASERDLGVSLLNPDEVIKLYEKEPLVSPVTLLSNPIGYNEVLIQGTTAFGKIEVVGVCVNPNLGYPEEILENNIEIAKRISEKEKIPLILLPKVHKNKKVEDSEISISINNNMISVGFFRKGVGYRYLKFNNEEFLQKTGERSWQEITEKEDYDIFSSIFFDSTETYIVDNFDYFSKRFPELLDMQIELYGANYKK